MSQRSSSEPRTYNFRNKKSQDQTMTEEAKPSGSQTTDNIDSGAGPSHKRIKKHERAGTKNTDIDNLSTAFGKLRCDKASSKSADGTQKTKKKKRKSIGHVKRSAHKKKAQSEEEPPRPKNHPHRLKPEYIRPQGMPWIPSRKKLTSVDLMRFFQETDKSGEGTSFDSIWD